MRAGRKLDILAGALLLAAFAYFPDRQLGVNGAAHFGQTYMVVHHHTLAIDPFLDYTMDWSRYGDHYYPGKAPGLSLLSVPFYMAIVSVEILAGLDAASMPATNGFVLNEIVNVLFAAVAGALLLATLRSLGLPVRSSILAVLGVALGTAYFPFATAQLYSHTPSAALLVVAAFFAFRERRGACDAALSGFAIGLAVLTEYACALAVPILGAWWFHRARPRLGWYLAGGLPVALAFMAYHWACFGSPFAVAYRYLNPVFEDAGSARIGNVPSPRALLELTFLPYRGTFFFSPVLLVCLAGFEGARRRRLLPEALVGGAFALVLLVLTSSFKGWHAGWTTGPRYFVPGVPLLAPLLALGLERSRRVGLAALAFSILNYLAVTFVRYDLPKEDMTPLSTVYEGFIRGEHVRPNLGNYLGLPGLLSLLPLLAVFAIAAPFVARLARAAEAEATGAPKEAA